MSTNRGVRTLVSLLMNALVVVAVLVTSRMVVQFFGSLSAQPWGSALISVTNVLVLPVDLALIKTPYGGGFDLAAALSVIVFLGVEWVLSVVRWRL